MGKWLWLLKAASDQFCALPAAKYRCIASIASKSTLIKQSVLSDARNPHVNAEHMQCATITIAI